MSKSALHRIAREAEDGFSFARFSTDYTAATHYTAIIPSAGKALRIFHTHRAFKTESTGAPVSFFREGADLTKHWRHYMPANSQGATVMELNKSPWTLPIDTALIFQIDSAHTGLVQLTVLYREV